MYVGHYHATHILVIADDELLSRILCRTVASVGHTTTAVYNGLQALEVVQLHHFDVIMLDLYLPVMDGLAFLNEYRKLTQPLAPVIAITAGPMSMPALPDIPIIKKPFTPKAILAAVANVLNKVEHL